MQLLCLEAISLAKQSFPRTVPTEDAINLTSELHDPNARMNHLHKRKKERT